MSFSPTITHDSKSVPGARFTVHRMGFGRRTSLDLATLAFRQRLRELEMENPPDNAKEKELNEQIQIARRKAMLVPEEEVDRVVREELAPLIQELAAAGDVDTRKRRAVLGEEYGAVESQIRGEWIIKGLVSLEGAGLDGMTAAQLLDFGPPELAIEVYNALATDGKVAGFDSKNSSSPITSGALVGGETGSTTAPIAAVQPAATT